MARRRHLVFVQARAAMPAMAISVIHHRTTRAWPARWCA